jgi:hypothetical protein
MDNLETRTMGKYRRASSPFSSSAISLPISTA